MRAAGGLDTPSPPPGRVGMNIATIDLLREPRFSSPLPEARFPVPLGPDGFLAALERRLDQKDHALVVVAEGAGQDMQAIGQKTHEYVGLDSFVKLVEDRA